MIAPSCVDKCYACGKQLKIETLKALTSDGQTVFVGPDCYKCIKKAHTAGYQPPLGGPKLYTPLVHMWRSRHDK